MRWKPCGLIEGVTEESWASAGGTEAHSNGKEGLDLQTFLISFQLFCEESAAACLHACNSGDCRPLRPPERLDASVCRLPALSHHFALAPACSTLSDLMCYCTLNRQDRSRHAERPNASRATIIVIRQSVITPPWLFLFTFQTNFWESR